LAAVEMWVKRDHKAEWAQWERWLNHIAESVNQVPGVTTRMGQGPEGLSNRSPDLTIQWDAKVGITGQDVSRILMETEPRITLAAAWGPAVGPGPYQLSRVDERVVADRLPAGLLTPPSMARPAVPSGPPAAVAGQWDVHLEFIYGAASHSIVLEQD